MLKKLKDYNNYFFIIISLSLILFLCTFCSPQECPAYTYTHTHKHKENWYVEKWCSEITNSEFNDEIRIFNNNNVYVGRVDCLTDYNAIEFDFAVKFQEAIGQSLMYWAYTNKYAGIVLIVEHKKDFKYVRKLVFIINKLQLSIKLWVINNIDGNWGLNNVLNPYNFYDPLKIPE